METSGGSVVQEMRCGAYQIHIKSRQISDPAGPDILPIEKFTWLTKLSLQIRW